MHKKTSLPKKICFHCGLEFSWRKKWIRDWEQVKYCGEKCRRNKLRILTIAFIFFLTQPSLFSSERDESDIIFPKLQTNIATKIICEDIPPHKHFFNSAIYLLEGRIFLTLGEQTIVKDSGDSWIEPRNVLHSGVIDRSFSSCAKIFAVYHHEVGQPISYND
ncbi:MAG: DUF2256 domain-containing protein [Gammaproteobacteria bacterium]